MTTKENKIAELKAEHPTIRIGSDEIGYTQLNDAEYEAMVAEWADNALIKETQKAEALATKQALLDKLGITEEEAVLLLGGN